MKFNLYHFSKSDIIVFLILIIILTFIGIYTYNWTIDLISFFTFINIFAVIAYLLNQYRKTRKIFDFTYPTNFYGFFFSIYFIIPLIISVSFDIISPDEIAFVSLIISLSFFCFVYGVKKSGLREGIEIKKKQFDKSSGKAILIIAILFIPLIYYNFYWRISSDVFFNQAFYYEQSTDFLSSFRDVFIQGSILPFIILIGFIAKTDDLKIAKIGRVVHWFYSISIIMIFALSSQTRPALTASILFLASLGFYKKIKFNFLKVAGIISLFLLIILVVQGQRSIIRAELMFSSNQLQTAFNLAIPSTLEAIENPELYSDLILYRAAGNIIFLSEIISKTDEDKSFLYGKGILINLSSLIPRILYPDKPVVTSPQIIVKDLLDLPLLDAALTPVNQFYVEFGIVGIIVGFFLFGFLLIKYINHTFKVNRMGNYIFFAYIIAHIIFIESELVVGLLSVLRNAVVVYLLYSMLEHIFRNEKEKIAY